MNVTSGDLVNDVVPVGLRVGSVAEACPVVDGGLGVPDVERIFRADPDLQAVIVSMVSGPALLTRREFFQHVTGPFGYGRSLHARSSVATLVHAGGPCVSAAAAVSEVAELVMLRGSGRRRREAVLVVADERDLRVAFATSIFERMTIEFRHAALHDALTGLPNRRYLEREGGAWLAGRRGSRVAVLYADLDGFKYVNDTFGHQVGDALLVEFARRLHGCRGSDDILVRLGGDEFALLMHDADETTGLDMAKRVVLLASAPFAVEGQVIEISATVGIAFAHEIPDHADGLDDLLSHADVAMLHAKSTGKRRVGRWGPRLTA